MYMHLFKKFWNWILIFWICYFGLFVKRLKNWLQIIFGDTAILFVVHFLLEMKNFFFNYDVWALVTRSLHGC